MRLLCLTVLVTALVSMTIAPAHAGTPQAFAAFVTGGSVARATAVVVRQALPGLRAEVYASKVGEHVVHYLYVSHPELKYEDICRRLGGASCPALRQAGPQATSARRKGPVLEEPNKEKPMTKQFSFVKYENEVLPEYRNKLSLAETAEDVRTCFGYTVRELFAKALNGEELVDEDDIILEAENEKGYEISEKVRNNETVAVLWEGSDLKRVMKNIADSAHKRIMRIDKHPEKTDAKIRN
ncbi:hypothetical protein ACI3L3_15140 [Desulfobaculum sp. SPO524]|uniref:hypothetical protein n=1 Tax=Desulfobaculum sp. SPO524 TaxID=3378071 RepID=UPI00385374E9